MTRRQTGGGGIYHDTYGDISYSITAPAAEFPSDLLDAYHELCAPILDAFDRMGVDARFVDSEAEALYTPSCYLRSLHPAHDIVAGGKKISGNAQYRRKDAVIQHGSLTYSVLADRHLSTFVDPRPTPTHSPIESRGSTSRPTAAELKPSLPSNPRSRNGREPARDRGPTTNSGEPRHA